MKKIVISILAIALIAGIGIAVIMRSDNNDSSSDNNSNNSESTQNTSNNNNSDKSDSNSTDDSESISSLKDLIGLGRQYQCSFSSTENGVTNSGKIYTDGTNLRGEYQTNIEGTDQDFNMIRTQENTYIWQENTSEGFIYENVDIDVPSNQSSTSNNQSLDIEEDINLKCSRWSISRGFFDRPNDVEFQDISANINQLNEATQGLDDIQKEACNTIPDEASKQLCLDNI